MKGNDAWTDKEKDVLLHPERALLPAIIHEILHNLYPYKDEDWVEKLEKKIARRITNQQMKNLFLILAEHVKKSRQKPQVIARMYPNTKP